ncbi:MAG: hypothetical protein MJZ13_09615 [Bacteroidales bacterium]|nr:hypothetical protein [Bacteroidales bacterium]
MKMNVKMLLAIAMMATVSGMFVACDDDDPKKEIEETAQEIALSPVNKQYVESVVVPTYAGLADAAETLVSSLEKFGESKAQGDLDKAGEAWKEARKYWEWSEAFLFGAASGYSIDPHIDTWPFDRSAFDKYMSKYNPSEDDDDAATLSEAIATGQNLTGFHAVEYLIFRDGKVRAASDLTANETWFAIEASNDLYLNSCKLLVAWKGEVSKDRQEMLDEAEFEADNFGEEFINAGQAGSRWKSATLAAVQIIEGCQDIVDEVAAGKIGAAYTGEDVNYIESPHAHNSITDFYDNVMSCKHALYGSMGDIKEAATGSLLAYTAITHSEKTAAVVKALEKALDEIDGPVNGMKRPFVNNYTDASCGEAIEALEALDAALDELKNALVE